MTAKGYPDFATRRFLTILAEKYPELAFFYLGDADPYGADIFFTYLFGSAGACIIDNKDRCETLLNLHWIGPFFNDTFVIEVFATARASGGSSLLKLSTNDKRKAYQILSKPFLADIYLASAQT